MAELSKLLHSSGERVQVKLLLLLFRRVSGEGKGLPRNDDLLW